MPVGSYLELILTTLGWQLYDSLWSIFVDTGLAYLPFLSFVITNISEPIKSQEAKSAAVTSLRRLETDIAKAITILMLCVQPSMAINYGEPTLHAACSAEVVKQGQTGTRFDELFAGDLTIGDGRPAKVPAWFYLVLSVSGGINNAFIASLPCDINIRQMRTDANLERIQDIHLRDEARKFIRECYRQARYDVYREKSTLESAYDQIGWIGAPYLVAGYYQNNYAHSPVHGWPLDSNRESDKAHIKIGEGTINPEWGYPRCDEWWLNDERGLRGRLLEEAGQSWLSKLTQLTGSPEEAENAAIRKLLRNEKQQAALDLTKAPSFDDGSMPGIIDLMWGAAEWVGGGMAATMVSFVTDMIVMAAPFVQALALFSIYMLLPLVFIVGNYGWDGVKTATITIFAIKFWTSIWAVVALLDNRLLTAMTTREGVHPIDYISNAVGFNHIIVDLLIAAMYVSLPGFLLMILSWAGEQGAVATQSMSNSMSGSAGSAGKSAGNLASSAAGKGVKGGSDGRQGSLF